jgi:two-component system sensor histidine kinase/response regulator
MEKKSVLLNAHHQKLASSVVGRLSGMGVRVHEAGSGKQALELISIHDPDVILLEAGHNGEGVEICTRLRTTHRYTGAIAIRVPDPVPAAEAAEWLDRGADAFIPDSADDALLFVVARSLLRLRSAEREVVIANEHMETLRQELQRSHQEFQQFALHASHDFQEPLRSIAAFIELMDRDRKGEMAGQQSVYLGYVLAGTQRLKRLLDYMLRYSQAAQENPSACGLVQMKSVTDGALRNLNEALRNSQAKVVVSRALPEVWGHFPSLQQLIESLVGNAIKYRRPDTPLSIWISAESHSPEEWLITIEDNGIGIAPQHHSSIFLPFKRLHGREIPGTGMGLALCRRIVQAHGGRIWVASSPGRGTKFLFTLGASPRPGQRAPGKE